AAQSDALVSHHDADIIVGFEQTTFDTQADAEPDVAPLAGLEPALSGGDAIAAGDASAESESIDLPLLEIPVEDVDLPESVGGDLTFIYSGETTPEAPDEDREAAAHAVDL